MFQTNIEMRRLELELKSVLYFKEDSIGIATLNQPERRHALSKQIRTDLMTVWDDFENDASVKVLIMTGAGDAFCAGGDLADMPYDAEGARSFLTDIINFLHRPEKLTKPVIAAVNGYALGGGLELAIASDIIIASEKARFGVPEPLVGLAPAFAMLRLNQIISPCLAKEIAFTGRQVTSEEAYRIGMVNKVVPHEKLMDEAHDMAKEILKSAPQSVWLLKSCLNRHMGGEDIAFAVNSMVRLFVLQDIREGIDAFFNKRKPEWKGS